MSPTPSTTGPTFAPPPPAAAYEEPPATFHPDTSRSWLGRLRPLVRARRRPLITMMVALVVTQAFQFAAPLAVRGAIDGPLAARVAGDTAPVEPSLSLDTYVWIIVGLGLGRLVFGLIHRYQLYRAGALLEYDLRTLLQRHLARQSFSWFDHTQTGQIISRANSDIRAIEMFLTFTPAVAIMLGSFVGAFAIMLSIHVPLTLVAVSALPLVFLFGLRMRRQVYPVAWIVQQRTADLAAVVEENLAGAHVVRGMAAERQQIALLDRAAERQRWAAEEEIRLRARYQPLLESLPRLAIALFVLYGGYLAVNGEVTVGTLFMFTLYIAFLQHPFRVLGFIVMMGQRARASAGRIFEVVDAEPEIVDADDARALIDPIGVVRLEHVRFGYGDGPDVLRDVSLELRPGETLALVGRTGSGKSTLARLLPRFYDVRDGRVTVDGHDVRELTLDSLRAHVGIVLEEPFLFTDSVRANIAFGRPDAPLDEVRDAAEAAGAAEFIDELPDGYHTVVGERGYTLSGGQRQRISIARMLLHNPKVLVLDDATSAIDVQVEQQIHDALVRLLATRTTLVIAHRLSTIALADRVAFLKDGVVAATGTHRELLDTVPEYADVLLHIEDREAAAAYQETEVASAPTWPDTDDSFPRSLDDLR